MKKHKKFSTKILSFALAIAVVVAVLPTTAFAANQTTDKWDGSIATAFASGNGTAENPYQIASGAQLAFLASEVNSGNTTYVDTYFKVIADIGLNNLQWTPIGNTVINMLFGTQTGNNYFEGTLDGDNHTISNLSIGSVESPYVGDVCGLFGASMGIIKDLNLDNVSINYTAGTLNGSVVGICGSLSGFTAGSVSNCKVTGVSMTTGVPDSGMLIANWIGGFVGTLGESSSIKNCSVEGMITEQSGNGSIGGFIGELGKTSGITYSSANVDISSTKTANGAAIGGFIGRGNTEIDPATLINHCYATGNVFGGGYVGGFVGNLSGVNIRNCYALGNVSNSYYGASFAGSDGGSSSYYGNVENCYTTGTVSEIQVGASAFFPQTEMKRSEITNCYFNSDLTPSSEESAKGKTLSDMKKSEFVILLNNGDASNGWGINENGTPYNGAESANYAKVDAAIAKIPADLSIYTSASVGVLNNAKNSVVRGKNITEQTVVDGYATAIENAVTALTYKGADYSKVDAAIAKIPTDLSIYTDASVKAVNHAKNAVIRDKNITEQATVNGYATAIENAITSLKKKTVSSISDDSTGTKVEYEDGTLFDTDIVLSVISKPQAEMDKLKDNVEKAAPGLLLGGLYDVKLLKDGVAIQPDGKIKISIPLTDKMKSMTNLQIVYIDDNGNVTIIPSEVKDGMISFITDHFGDYGVISKVKSTDPGDNSNNGNTNSPQTGDNSPMLLFVLMMCTSGTVLVVPGKKKTVFKRLKK